MLINLFIKYRITVFLEKENSIGKSSVNYHEKECSVHKYQYFKYGRIWKVLGICHTSFVFNLPNYKMIISLRELNIHNCVRGIMFSF